MKNKIIKRKIEFIVIFLSLAFIAVMKLVTMTVSPVSAEGEANIPSLFYNDRAFELDDVMPLKQFDGIYYVPIEFIKQINHIVMKSKDKDNFYLQYKEYNYISFNVSSNKAESLYDENIPCKVYFDRNITYVPAKIVADALGLTMEIRYRYNTVRIKESTATKTFDELIERYIRPSFLIPTEPPITSPPEKTTEPIEEITSPPVIEQPPLPNANETTTEKKADNPVQKPPPPIRTTEPEPTTPENTREIENYLLFYNGENKDIDEKYKTEIIDDVLKILDKEKMRAMFFLSVNEIIENPDILRKIYASGHGLGIKFGSGGVNNIIETDDLFSELEAANDLIYSALKHKTRFCMFEDGRKIIVSEGEELYNYEDKLKEKGYYLCEKTLDINNLGKIKTSNEMIEFMKQNELNIFAFNLGDLNNNYKNYLQLSAKAMEIKFYIKFSYINNANIKDIKDKFKQIKDGE